jgi:hypothetical protein
MTPPELAHAKAARLTDPAARAAAQFAADRLRVEMFQRDGVVTRGQLAAAGLGKADVERLLRRNALRRVHRSVFVDHTGPLTHQQRIWAAVLALAPAVVCGPTLLRPDPEAAEIHVAIDASRRVSSPRGVRVHRVRGLDAVAQWRAEPPRMRREDAVLALVDAAATDLEVVRLMTDAARTRDIGADRLRAALGRRSRLRRRALVTALLDDIDEGANSVLEWGYVRRVERAHGLPRPDRQVTRRTPGGKEYRDAEYDALRMVIELDGRLNHDSWEAENRDADRDLADHADGKLAVRLRWRQVFGTPCATAGRLAIILQGRGWTGHPRRCGPGCTLIVE